MTEAMPFLQKAILLSYAPRSLVRGAFSMLQGSAISPVSKAVLVLPGKG